MNKKYIIIAAITILLAAVFTKQLILDKHIKTASESNQIKHEEQSFSAIEKQINMFTSLCNAKKKTYVKKNADVNQLSTEGASVTGCFDNNKLMFLESSIFGETGQKQYNVYYITRNLTYLYTTEYSYDKPVTEPDYTVAGATKTEYIIMDNRLSLYNNEAKALTEVKNPDDILDTLEIMQKSLINKTE